MEYAGEMGPLTIEIHREQKKGRIECVFGNESRKNRGKGIVSVERIVSKGAFVSLYTLSFLPVATGDQASFGLSIS